jgi:hypothetical protein
MSFDAYNPTNILQADDTHTIDFPSLDNIDAIITQVGRYQVYVDFSDAA